MKKTILIFASLAIVLAATTTFIYQNYFKIEEKTLQNSGQSCAAFHSGANSPFEKATCSLANGSQMQQEEILTGFPNRLAVYPKQCGIPVTSKCEKGGQFSGPYPLYSSCTQLCVNPDTLQPVEQGQKYSYYLISAGTSEQCKAALKTATCQENTGLFLPDIDSKLERFLSCSVLKAPGSRIMRWSDPETWAGHPPKAGDNVIIPDGRLIILDTDPPPLLTLQIDGVLIFANRDITLIATSILLRGSLQIGTLSAPFKNNAKIQITLPPSGSPINQGLLMLSGGQFDIYGKALSEKEIAEGGATYAWGARRYSNIFLEVVK